MSKSGYIGYRPTWAEINLSNLAYNFRQVKKRLSAGVKVMVTVKADAYGHGLIPVASQLQSQGADYFGVASIDEGILLREHRISVPILVLGMVLIEDIAPLFRYNLSATVCTQELALALHKKALKLGKKIKVHVKVDTGMARIGVTHTDALALISKVSALRAIALEGIFTHFAFADMDESFTTHQIHLFNQLVAQLAHKGITVACVHAANSMGVLQFKQGHFTMVRPGLVIYGLYPRENLTLHLKPVLSLKTKVVFTKRVPKGQGISYGHIYVTKRDTTIVTLPIGYGDGYPRNLSNLAPVLIKGKRFQVSGRICMDQIMVDVGNLPVKVGDEVVLIGRQGAHKITAEELATLSGTIPYEIVCGLGSRVPRVYTGKTPVVNAD